MIEKLKQTFCIHDYRMMPKFDDQEERARLVSELKEGEMIAFSRMHKCKKCNKERMLGSGLLTTKL